MFIFELANRAFWKEYWERANCTYLISENFRFSDIIKKEYQEKHFKNFLEIGGFPGNYSIYISKYLNVNSTLLDFYIDENIIESFFKYNGLDKDKINLIEHDLFTYEVKEKFDFVLSVGFIEHFKEVDNVIHKHLEFVKEGGTLIMTIPNLVGATGLAHFLWHRENLHHHNLALMKINAIKKILKDLNITDYEVFYNGSFGMWLDNYNDKSKLNKFLYDVYKWLMKRVSKVVKIKRIFAPHLVIKINR